MKKCPWCEIKLSNNENRGSSSYEWHCEKCDRYFKLSHDRYFFNNVPGKLEHITGSSYRYRTGSAKTAHYDKPPCCYVKFHEPQIKITREFHEFYQKMREQMKGL